MAARWIAAIARTMLRVLVRLQPRAFRDRFGRDVLEDVRDEIDGALSSGARATLATSSLAIGDAARGVAAERLRELQRLTWRDLSMFKGLSTDLMMASRRVRSGPMLTLIVVATDPWARGPA